jgi:phosphotriesterase-related protein
MRQEELTGKVQTVLGIIDGDSLGVTLPHEHLLTDLAAYFVEPAEASQRKLAHEPVRLENLYWVKPHCQSNVDNMKLTDIQLAIKEAMLYKLAGGDTIVELTNIGLHRDPLGLACIARATGLNIVMGAGYYIGASHPLELATRTEQEIAEEIVRDIMVGVDRTEVRAGVIGEIGCSLPLENGERKVLRASAAAQQETGAALYIHPSPHDDLVLEIIKILGDAGADLSRTIISHVDNFCFSRTTRHGIADAGCYLEYDCFGYPGLFPLYQGRVLDTPSPTQRINDITQLIADGYLDQILISSDTCHKHQLVNYGGYGYAHILRDIVPLMRNKGMSDEQIHTLLVENPKRVLPFAPVKQ